MKYTKEEIIAQMKATGLVPLFTHDNTSEALEVIEAAYKGGIRVFEFTNRRKNSFDVFTELVKQLDRFPGLMLGIGTVMDGATTQKFIDTGAHFIIAPIMKVEMAEVCNRNNIAWMPGCATLTEIVTARDHGAEMIKVFPGSVLGPGFISSIMPVIPDVQLMITGGVEPTEQSLRSWFSAGAACVGLGSQLFTKEILAAKDWTALAKKIEDALDIIKTVRKG